MARLKVRNLKDWPYERTTPALDADDWFFLHRVGEKYGQKFKLAMLEAVLGVGAGDVGTTELADNAVTLAKMADSSVGTDELIDENVTEAKLGTGSVTVNKLGSESVSGVKIKDGAIGNNHLSTDCVESSSLNDGAATQAGQATDSSYSITSSWGSAVSDFVATVSSESTVGVIVIFAGTCEMSLTPQYFNKAEMRIWTGSTSLAYGQVTFQVASVTNATVHRVPFCLIGVDTITSGSRSYYGQAQDNNATGLTTTITNSYMNVIKFPKITTF